MGSKPLTHYSRRTRARGLLLEVGDPVKGEGKARRVTKHPVLTAYFDPDIRTIHQLYENSAKTYPERNFVGTRAFLPDGKRGAYEWITYAQARERWVNLASGLRELGLKKADRVGIFSINRAEWIISDAACHHQSFVPVALYATLGANAVEFVVNHAEITVVLCDGKNIDKVLALTNCANLKTVITFDPFTPSESVAATLESRDLKVIYIADLEKTGKEHPHAAEVPTPDDWFTIMYTSGSTGNPKGVLLTHGNMVAEVAGTYHSGLDFNQDEVHMSYLPLAHSFERTITSTITAFGGSIGFFQGSIPELFNDISELKPTFLCGAPRVWQRLHDKMWLMVNSGSWLKKQLFSWGVSSKIATVRAGGSTPIWDTILFSQTKAKLGGRVKWIISGSAPLDPKISAFLSSVFCCPVMQGYDAAGACLQYKTDPTTGHVGPPLSCTEVKLVDVPEMNYYSTDKPLPRGEICLRGPNLFIGYYKDPEKTAEDLRADGWFHTGDVGRWNENGTLSIIDRKKNIFKLSQGEYVAAEYLEGVFVRSPFVGQIFVYGDSLNSFLVAVIVPDFDVLNPYAAELGIPNTDKAELVKNKKIEEVILKSLTEVGKEASLHGFEFPKAIHIEHEPFSEENNLLTPTFKLRRPNLKEHYQQIINEIYAAYKKTHPDA